MGLRLYLSLLISASFILACICTTENVEDDEACDMKMWYLDLLADGIFDKELTSRQQKIKSTISKLMSKGKGKGPLMFDCDILNSYEELLRSEGTSEKESSTTIDKDHKDYPGNNEGSAVLNKGEEQPEEGKIRPNSDQKQEDNEELTLQKNDAVLDSINVIQDKKVSINNKDEQTKKATQAQKMFCSFFLQQSFNSFTSPYALGLVLSADISSKEVVVPDLESRTIQSRIFDSTKLCQQNSISIKYCHYCNIIGAFKCALLDKYPDLHDQTEKIEEVLEQEVDENTEIDENEIECDPTDGCFDEGVEENAEETHVKIVQTTEGPKSTEIGTSHEHGDQNENIQDNSHEETSKNIEPNNEVQSALLQTSETGASNEGNAKERVLGVQDIISNNQHLENIKVHDELKKRTEHHTFHGKIAKLQDPNGEVIASTKYHLDNIANKLLLATSQDYSEKIKGLEIQILKLENVLLHDSLTKNNNTSTFSKLENHILKLENELLKINNSFTALKVENDHLKQNQKVQESNIALVKKKSEESKYPQLADNSTMISEVIVDHQNKIKELATMIHLQTDYLKQMEEKTQLLEQKNKELMDKLDLQSQTLESLVGKVINITAWQFEQEETWRKAMNKLNEASNRGENPQVVDGVTGQPDNDEEKPVSKEMKPDIDIKTLNILKRKDEIVESKDEDGGASSRNIQSIIRESTDLKHEDNAENKASTPSTTVEEASDVNDGNSKKQDFKNEKPFDSVPQRNAIQREWKEKHGDEDKKNPENENKSGISSTKQEKGYVREDVADLSNDQKKNQSMTASIGPAVVQDINSAKLNNKEEAKDIGTPVNDNKAEKSTTKQDVKEEMASTTNDQEKEQSTKASTGPAVKPDIDSAKDIIKKEEAKGKVTKAAGSTAKVSDEANGKTKTETKKEKSKTKQEVQKLDPINIKPGDKSLKDCFSHYMHGRRRDTPIKVKPFGSNKETQVYCDMKNGAWTVIMRRQDGSIEFYREWEDYKNGFGNVYGEYWVGNDNLHYLTNQDYYTLRIELTDWDRKKYYAEYDYFIVESEDNHYRLNIGGYHGDAGDSMTKHNGHKFSTFDVDNDKVDKEFGGSCAKRFSGGWWYYKCYQSNLTGRYYVDGEVAEKRFDGVAWKELRKANYSFKKVEMKIRPTSAKVWLSVHGNR